MSEMKICRICLRTDAKVYHYEQFHLKSYYEEVLASKVSETDELPHFFCFECATMLHKFHKFKEKCFSGQKVLKELLRKGPAGILELSMLTANVSSQETEVESPFLEADLKIIPVENPVMNNELNITAPVEIDSFFINSLDVVLADETIINNASLITICNETSSNEQLLQEPALVIESNLSKDTNVDLNGEKGTESNQLPIDILPNVDESMLESDLGYEEIDSNLSENLEGLDDNDSMLYGDLPSISEAFDDSNIDLDLKSNSDIDADLISDSDIPNTSQECTIEYNTEAKLDLTQRNNDNHVEKVVRLSANNDDYLVQDTHKNSESIITPFIIKANHGSEANSNLLQTELCFINKDVPNKVKITSKNQVAPNIHSVLPTTSQEYIETNPESEVGNIDSEEPLNQLEVETRIEGPFKKKSIKSLKKKPFNKTVKPSPCNKKCGNDCSVTLTDLDRLVIHERYWKMNKKEQQDWLLSCIRPKPMKRRYKSTFTKNSSYDYFINHKGEDIKVCQQFLMKTLDISQMRFRYVISKHAGIEKFDNDSNLSTQKS